jgi:hypothetical protein
MVNYKNQIKMFRVIWIVLFAISIYGCDSQPKIESKCSCISVGNGEREEITADNEYVKFRNPKSNFEIQLRYLKKEKEIVVYKYEVNKITAGGMYDPTTIAKVNCKKGEIEFFKSKKYKGRSFDTYEENVYSWRAVGIFKIDKKSNLHRIGPHTSNQFNYLIHVESF